MRFIEALVGEVTIEGDTVKIPPRWVYGRHLGGLVAETVCYDLKRLGVPEEDRLREIPTIDPLWTFGYCELYELARREYLGRCVVTMYCTDERTAVFVEVPVPPENRLFGGRAGDIVGATRWR